MKKVKKITPIKSPSLCEKCEYDFYNECGKHRNCFGCPMYKEEPHPKCICNTLENGEPCPHFERANTKELKNNATQ